MIISKVVSNFNTGEISPRLSARVDFDKYHSALERLENFIVLPQGPVTRAPGSVFMLETKDSTKKSRLVKFQFNTADAYVLEFGDYYVRVFKNKARVGTVEIATPYSESDIWDLQFEQSFDVMWIFSPNYWPRKLTRSGTDDTVQANWGLNVMYFDPPPSYVANTDLEVDCVAGSTGNCTIQGEEDVEFDAVGDVFVEADIGRALIYGAAKAIITGLVAATGNEANKIDDKVKATIADSWDTDGVTMTAKTWYLTGSPVAAITCSDKGPIGEIVRVIATDNYATPKGVTLTYSGTTITCAYTVNHGLTTSDYVLISGAENGYYNGIFKVVDAAPGGDATKFTYTAKKDPQDNPGGSPKCLIGYAAFRSADKDKYIKTNEGLLKITKYVNPHLVKAKVLSTLKNKDTDYAGQWSLEEGSFGLYDLAAEKSVDTITVSGNIATADLPAAHGYSAGDHVKITGCNKSRFNHVFRVIDPAPGADTTKFTFHVSGNSVPASDGSATIKVRKGSPSYPVTGHLYKNRLFLAGSQKQPNNVWGSAVGQYENFAVGTKDDSALDYPISVSNQIRWLRAVRKLVAGTYGEELLLWTEDGKAISPTNPPDVIRQTTHGSADVAPLVVGNKILFVERSGNRLREFKYDYTGDEYIAEDLNTLAEHITSPVTLGAPDWDASGIIDMTYQQAPNSIVWAVRQDGYLLALTYDKLNNVYAWARRYTGVVGTNIYGQYESVLSVPATGRDVVYTIVRRYINGAWKRYIEYLEDDQWTSSDGWAWPQVYTDCAKIYSGASTSTITGLSHLEGKEVCVIGNGVLLSRETVSGGQITIDTACTKVEVGLPYESHGLTVRPEVNLPNGTSQGRKKRWTRIVARLYETMAGYINEEPMEYYVVSSIKTPFTGDYLVKNLGYDMGGRICFRQPDPLPFTLLGISGSLDIE